MNRRNTLTGVLLAFVAVSFGFLALRSLKAAKSWRAPQTAQAASIAPDIEKRAASKVIAYYFHVTVRCATCRAIEAYSKQVIHERFAKELTSGQLEWRLVNVQLPENRHFINDYQLFTKSLVLVREAGGRQKEFKVLNDTWELVGDKVAMQRYVEKEVREYLRKL
ncbi:MAG: hypothetical protein HXY18_00920 [Bryobacteraceae bacterium]|nr:hypothetical protein [Bryobacteraceae bacterium]